MTINKILLFGATGMLGNYIYSYFTQFSKIPIYIINYRFTEENIHNLHDLLITYKIDESTCIINCIGQIPQRMEKDNKYYYFTNSIFPNLLWQICQNYKAKMIQPTTDCVFSGKRKEGMYNELDIHDESNNYGISKSLGEPKKCTIIRTSIIGCETRNKKSFMEWVLNHPIDKIKGWDNHIWNGITCLEYCKLIEHIIINNLFWEGVRHFYSPTPVSKYEMIKIISKTFEIKFLEIIKYDSTEVCNKTLCSIYSNIYNIPDIKLQINDIKDFKLLL